jgi:hypothetical protein
MKVKVIKPYTDKELSKNMVVGTEFETSNERAKVLIDKDFCIAVERELERGIVIVEKPKQTRKRKTK